jgi:hypothetical protein
MKVGRRALVAQQQVRLREVVGLHGPSHVAATLGVSPQTVASLAAGFVVHTAIVEMVERQLAVSDDALGGRLARTDTRAGQAVIDREADPTGTANRPPRRTAKEGS